MIDDKIIFLLLFQQVSLVRLITAWRRTLFSSVAVVMRRVLLVLVSQYYNGLYLFFNFELEDNDCWHE